MHRILPLIIIIAALNAFTASAQVTTRLEISGDILTLSYSDSRDAVIFRRGKNSGYNVPPMKIDIPGEWTLDNTPRKSSSLNEPPAVVKGGTSSTPLKPSANELPSGVTGKTYSHSLKPSGKGAKFSAKGLPDGLRISSSGKISGVPKRSGVFTVDITEQRRSKRAKTSFTLSISDAEPSSPDIKPESPDSKLPVNSRDIHQATPAPKSPRILSTSITQAFTDEDYTFTLKASETVEWSCDTLPEGLSLNSDTGVISGVPENDFKGKINVTAVNENGKSVRSLRFSVNTRRPKITTSILPEGFVSEDYIAGLKAEGGKGITWSFRGKIPEGLSLSKSGVIHGVPEKAGNFTLNVSAQNSGGRTSRRLWLKVLENEPHEYVTAAVIPAITVSADGRYEFTVSIDSSIPEGAYIEWHSFPYGVEADGEIYTLKDSNGREIIAVPKNHSVTVSAYLEGGVMYEPLITARVTAKELPNVGQLQQGTYSGCNAFGIFAFAVIFLMGRGIKRQ